MNPIAYTGARRQAMTNSCGLRELLAAGLMLMVFQALL
jgi:hypothetical protein